MNNLYIHIYIMGNTGSAIVDVIDTPIDVIKGDNPIPKFFSTCKWYSIEFK